MSEEDKPPSPEELKEIMEKAAKITAEKKAEQEAKVKSLDLEKSKHLEDHLAEKAKK